MAQSTKRRRNAKTVLVRVISITLAALMLLCAVMAGIWQW